MDDTPTISTHVLDTGTGGPARGVEVALERQIDGSWTPAGSGTTDDDGRIRRLLAAALVPGEYRIHFSLAGPFFRQAAITFSVDDTDRSYHVPLLIAPYSLSTYRGS